MAQNQFVIGDKDDPVITLDNYSVISANIQNSVDPIGAEFSIGMLEIVFHFSGFADLYCPSDYADGMTPIDGGFVYCKAVNADIISSIPYGTEIRAVINDNYLDLFYVKEVRQTGPDEYTIFAQNYAGVLDDYDFPGANLSADWDNWTVKSIMNMIFGYWSNYNLGKPTPQIIQKIYSRVCYQFPEMEEIGVFGGRIGACTKKEALQQFLFSMGYSARIGENEEIIISLNAYSVKSDIPSNLIYDGGDAVSLDPVSAVTITEYTYLKDAAYESRAPELIFDNTENGTDTDVNWVIIDGAPVSGSLTLSGGVTVNNWNAFLKITGKGTVKGKRMSEIKRDITIVNEAVRNGREIKIDVPTVSFQNSAQISDRIKAYFLAKRQEITHDIVCNGQRPGEVYRFRDPFQMMSFGYLSDMTVDVSAKTKARCKFVSGFIGQSTEFYARTEVLTGDGIWYVPEGVTSFIAILVGGGSGGSSGLKGADGTSQKHASSHPVEGNKNGSIGTPGEGGLILQVTIDDPEPFYRYSCGSGGEGGALCSSTEITNPGAPGSDTVFGAFKSSGGSRNPNGIQNNITYNRYGAMLRESDYNVTYKPGWRESGYYSVTPNDNGFSVWHSPALGASYVQYVDGVKSERTSYTGYTAPAETISISSGSFSVCHGAGGGGANFANGEDGHKCTKISANKVALGSGGNGATPDVPGIYPLDIGPLYGYGGGPGYGGGGGGDAGFALSKNTTVDNYVVSGDPGIGGLGGVGGRGAPGCVILYY